MPPYTTPYRPSIHGFHFNNGFRNEVAGPIATWGRCNGMSSVSLDYFNAGRPAPAISVVDYGLHPISGLGAASWSADHIELFVRREDDKIACKTLNSAAPGAWESKFSNGMTGSPAAASWGPERVDLIARASDGTYMHQARDSRGWINESRCSQAPGYIESLGGPFDSSPAAAAPFDNRLELYAIHHGELQFRYWDGTQWQEWASLGHPPNIILKGDPAAASQYGWMGCVAWGTDDGYWLMEWANGGWQPWRPIGNGRFSSSPAVASPFSGRAEVYGRGLDGGIWIYILQDAAPGQWDPLGAPPPGLTEDRPGAVGHYGHLSVYAVGNDRQMWQRRWSGGNWLNWELAEPPITAESNTLTQAIYNRLMDTTINPLLVDAATALIIPFFPPPSLLFQGAVRNFITLRLYGNDQLFQWANNDEIGKLIRFLGNGQPIGLGLLDTGGGTGHEVVAYGAMIDAAHGGINSIDIYDPNYPDCDNIKIELDPATRTIRSSSGETWRALFVRDDYTPQPPPV